MVTLVVDPHTGNNTRLELFDASGASLSVSDDSGGLGAVDTVTRTAPPTGETIFVGVSSSGNTAYSATVAGSGASGTTIGSYVLRVNVDRDVLHASTVLTANVAAGANVVSVSDVSKFPAAPFTLQIGGEQVRVTGVNAAANTFNIVRGLRNTTGPGFFVPQTTLTAATTSFATTLTVAATAGFPTAPFVIEVGSEQMTVTAINSATQLQVLRGARNTLAATHIASDRVELGIDYYSAVTTVPSGVPSATASIIAVAATSNLPPAPFSITIGSERMRVVSISRSASMLTVERGIGNTTAAVHAPGSAVEFSVDWLADDNSSFASAVNLGTLGVAEKSISASIEQQSAFTTLPEFPGGLDEVGHRAISPEVHIGPVPPTFNTTDFGGYLNGFDLLDPTPRRPSRRREPRSRSRYESEHRRDGLQLSEYLRQRSTGQSADEHDHRESTPANARDI